tara:strand:+ start:70 stop:324 length:255 start_codon:yes stop_codon:yes gene_type:complete
MLDHYSEYPCPEDETCIEEIKDIIRRHYKNKIIIDDNLNNLIQETLNEQKPLGSLSGWYVFSQKSVFEKTIAKIKNTTDCKIKK